MIVSDHFSMHTMDPLVSNGRAIKIIYIYFMSSSYYYLPTWTPAVMDVLQYKIWLNG